MQLAQTTHGVRRDVAAESIPLSRADRHNGRTYRPSAYRERAAGAEVLEKLADLQREVETLRRRNRAYRENIRRLDDQLGLTASLQRDLHSPMPVVDGVDIHAIYRPADVVSGDMYEVVRLDETHIAIAVADATGHGLPAGLLSTFVRQSLRGGDVANSGNRLPGPDEVLARANTAIIESHLRDCQFVTAAYAIYDERTRLVRWARGGAPYPILVRRGRRPRQLRSDGPLLGAVPRPHFENAMLQLEPGDTLLFHTDGLDSFLLDQHRDLGCCDLPRTDWYQDLGRKPVDKHFEALEDELTAAPETGESHDDVTVVALHVRADADALRAAANHHAAPAAMLATG